MPISEQVLMPSTNTHARVSQRAAASWQLHAVGERPDAERDGHLGQADDQHHAELADEVGDLRHGRAGQPLEGAVVLFQGDRDGECLEADAHHPRGHDAGDHVLAEVHPGVAELAAEDGAEQHQDHHREREGEDHRLPVAGEGLELQPDAGEPDRDQARRAAGAGGADARHDRVENGGLLLGAHATPPRTGSVAAAPWAAIMPM
jgi:hypothetical protein